MIVVGLTGGIGSGKTTVANMFHKLGVPIYIADLEAKKLMTSSKIIKRKLIQLFGEEAYTDGKLNKPFLSGKIYNDKKLLLKMNAIVHPKVRSHFNRWLKKQNTPYVIKEAAILFENGGYHECDYVITVIASEEDKIKRVILRDNSSAKKVKAIMNTQWSDAEKVKLSHFVINNDNLSETENQVKIIHQKILKLI
ncbi:MAG: dephospho-CoA kinase [Flavobacteriaceae bacterium]|nr:dephospho-CoA kinase [Flavobacteriaceae bacterium]